MESQLVVFRLAGELWGLEIEQVKEINRMVPITTVPMAPESVLGIINLRGQVIPVIGLRERLGLEQSKTTDDTRIIITELMGMYFGIVVDSVEEVLRLGKDEQKSSFEVPQGVDSAFVQGIVEMPGGLVLILDLQKVLDFSVPTKLVG